MSNKSNSKYSVAELIVLVIYSAAAIYVFAGFLGFDAYAADRFGRIYLILLWGMRIGIPAIFVGGIYLYHGIKTGRFSIGNIVLAVLSLVVSLFFSYLFLDYYYNSARIETKIKEYHPYLQISPIALSGSDLSQDVFDIVCLGGSTTEFRDSENRGWPDRVEAIIRERSGKGDIKVHNFGRQWYTTLHTLINYETNISKYKVDAIIVMHNINDLLHNADFSYFSHGLFREDYGHFYGPVDLLITGRNFVKVLWERVDLWYPKSRQIVDQTEFPGIVPFERNLNTLVDLADRDGTQVVLMTQPYLLKPVMTDEERDHLHMLNAEAVGPTRRWSLMSGLRGMESYNAVVRRVAETRGIPLIDLEKVVPKSLEYFLDEVHYQDKTFDLIADYVANELLTKSIVRGRR